MGLTLEDLQLSGPVAVLHSAIHPELQCNTDLQAVPIRSVKEVEGGGDRREEEEGK